MAIILIIACSNFICINYSVQETEKQTKDAINKIDSIYMCSPSIKEEGQKDTNLYVNEIKESIWELNNLKKGIFDSNTITFLSSFVLVFLGGILFDIEKRAKEKLSKSKDLLDKMEVELNQIKIAKRLNIMSILSKYLQLQFSSSKYQITEDIINIANELNKSFQDFLSLLQDKKTKYITEDAQKEYISVLNEIDLLLSKEDINLLECNKNKLKYIFTSQNLLSKCKDEIESMKNSNRVIGN